MSGYVCFYCGKRFEVFAPSLLKARELAIAHFKPSKAKMGLLSVVLAEIKGKPVSQPADF